MKTQIFISVLLTLLPALITATPLKRQYSSAFTMLATHSGDPRVHLRPINANSSGFWIGRHTSSFCPQSPVVTCPPGIATVLEVPASPSSGIITSHEVPGEQEVYIQGPTMSTPGSFSFNSAHTAVPIDAITDKFSFTGTDLVYTDGAWWACPAEGAYFVLAAASSPSDQCIGINIDTFPFTGETPAAWQYV